MYYASENILSFVYENMLMKICFEKKTILLNILFSILFLHNKKILLLGYENIVYYASENMLMKISYENICFYASEIR